MALPALESSTPSLGRLTRLVFRPSPERASTAFRTSIACMIAVLIGEIWQLPLLNLIPIILSALWQENRMLNFAIGKTFLIFFTCIVGCIYVGTLLTVNNFFATLFVNVAFSFIFFFLSTASSLKFIGIVGGLMLSYLLLTLDTISNSDQVTRFILYVWLIFLITGGILLIGGLLLSESPRKTLMRHIAYRLDLAAKRLILPDTPSLNEETRDTLHEGTGKMLLNLALSTKEKIWPSRDLNRLRQAALNSFAILALSDSASRHLLKEETETRQEISKILQQAAQYFREDSYPENIKTPQAQHPLLQKISLLLSKLTDYSEEALPPPPPPPKFFTKDAFTNPLHVRLAVKGTFSVLLSIVIYKALNWPGIHTCVITCFIVSMPTMGEVISRQTLRIIGALIGCLLSMLIITFLMPHLTNIAQIMLVVGAVIFIGTWIRAGDASISYIGLQIMVAFLLSDLTQYGPATDLTIPRDRIIGVLIGLSISYIIHIFFWPNSATAALNNSLQKIQSLLDSEENAETDIQRIFLASKVQESINAAQQSLRNSMLEPSFFRPKAHKNRQYQHALSQATIQMEDLLFLPASSKGSVSSPILTQLEDHPPQ